MILGAAVVAICAIGVLQYNARRGTYRPLSSRQPAQRQQQAPELGMEAIDMAEIRRTQRSNESLERTNNIWSQRNGAAGGLDIKIDGLTDDETYARRFHAAFMKNKD